MVRLLTALFLAVAIPAAPISAQEPEILSSSDVKSLNRKAADWMEAWLKYTYESDSAKERRNANRALSKAKEAFRKEWDGKSRKADPMSSVADLRAVFADTFPYERQSSSGVLKTVDAKDDLPGYSIMLPKRYDPKIGYLAVVVLPGFDAAKSKWSDAKDHYDATWGASSLVEESIYVAPGLDAAMELDLTPDFSKPGADQDETARIRAVLGAAGRVQRELNIDRERLFLDTGSGAGAYAIRLASYFPNRFAGLIIRHPVDVSQELRLGSLAGLPVLLIASEATKDAAAALAKNLNDLGQGSCTVLDGKGGYPFKDSQPEVDEWIKGIRRQLTPTKVVIEPNHDQFNDGYWVRLGVTDPFSGVPDEQKPRIAVEADKASNRIKVDARGVSDFMLLLNDDIVDLDKEFTVEVNGVLFKEKRDRNLTFLTDQMQEQFDPSWTFTTFFATTVPKPPAGGK